VLPYTAVQTDMQTGYVIAIYSMFNC